MPRHSYGPSIFERLEQSRIARSEQPAVPAPEPEPRRFNSHQGVFAAWSTHVFDTLAQERGCTDFAELEAWMLARMDRSRNGHSQDLFVIDEAQHLPRFDPSGDVPIPAPEAAEPKTRSEQPMNQPTQHTMLTVLQQGVADAIRLIREVRELLAVYPGQIIPVAPYAIDYIMEPRTEVHYQVEFGGAHPNNERHVNDTYTTFSRTNHYPHRKLVQVRGLVLRHRAVINEVRLLAALFPESETYDAMLKVLERGAIEDFTVFFANRMLGTGAQVHPTESADAIPQLYARASDIYTVLPGDSAGYAVKFDLDTPLWQVRERLRMAHGTYLPLPPEVLALLPQQVCDTQFPHLAVKPGNAGMIAYTQSPVAGALDHQQVIKAGRYIRQHCEDLTDEDVKQAAAAVLGACEMGINVSSEEDDFARVYIEGPSSCMAYDESGKEFSRLIVDGKFFHPCRVYAHPENHIQIVWVEVNGRIGARALVNTRNKRYPRIYKSDSVTGAHSRLLAWLETHGFSHSDGALDGEKLLRVSPDRYPDAIICPYIDDGNRSVEIYDDYLIVGGEYEANHETGCLHSYDTEEESPDWYCDHCGDGYSDDDDSHETDDHERVCQGCVDRHYTWALEAESGRQIYVDDCETFYVDKTPGYHNRTVWMGNGSGEYVYLDENYYSDAVVMEEYAVRTEDDEYILQDDCARLGFFYDESEYVARPIEEWAVLDGELTRRDEVPDEAQRLPLMTDPDYPELPVYQMPEDDEEAAA